MASEVTVMNNVDSDSNNSVKYKQVPLSCRGHTRPVVFLDFSDVTEYGYFLISACKDGKPMLRYGDTGDWIGTFIGHKGAVWGCSLNPDATIAATGSADFTAKLWNAESGDEIASLAHSHIVRSIHISRDSKRLLTAAKNKVYLYDVAASEKALLELNGHENSVKLCCFLPNGNFALSSAEDASIRLWELATGREVAQCKLSTNATGMHLSQDGSVLTVACASQVLFYSIPSMTLIKSFDVNTPVLSACLSPDSSSFIFGGEDFNVHRWNYKSGKEIASYKGHFGPVHCVRFSPDGALYASGSEDGTLRLWRSDLSKSYGLWKVVDAEE